MNATSANEHEIQVDGAIESLGLSAAMFVKCDAKWAAEVVQAVRERFVDGNPRVWWLALKQPYQSYAYQVDEWPACLVDHVPSGAQACWLILESDSNEYPVYWAAIEEVPRVLSECGFFEYYLVDDKVQWLIADTDHNEIVVAHYRGEH